MSSGCVASDEVDRRCLAALGEQHGRHSSVMRSTSSCEAIGCSESAGLGIERHVEHRPKRLAGRVRHHELEHEAVQLRFGQRIGSFLLDRILRGQHEKRARQGWVRRRRHLLFLHGFEQGRLRLRGRARLISSASRSWRRPGPAETKSTRPPSRLSSDFGARDVGWHQVGSELHARPFSPSAAAMALARWVLPSPGNPSISTWPPANTAVIKSVTSARCPTITRSSSARRSSS